MRPPILALSALLTACGGGADPVSTELSSESQAPFEPEAPTLSIAPSAPTTSDDLVATIGESLDADGAPLLHSLSWARDGDDAGISVATVPASATAKGQVWVASVSATHDNTTLGPVEAEVTILNTPPVVGNVLITPLGPTTLDDLSCVGVDLHDDDDDEITLSYAWHVDGEPAGTETTLASGAFVKDQAVTCTVTPNDGEDDGEPLSAEVFILNSPPGAPGLTIEPSAPRAGVDDLHCQISTPALDVDDDPLTYRMTWTVDDQDYPGDFSDALGPTSTTWTDDTVPAEDTLLGTIWSCTARADDGEDIGPGASTSVEVRTGCADLLVGALPGWGSGHTGSSLRWTNMLDQQEDFGLCYLSIIDIEPGFTLDTLADLDIVLIPNVGGGTTVYTTAEAEAIEAYIDGGYGGAVATFALSWTDYGWPEGARIFGVDPAALSTTSSAISTEIDIHDPGHPLMTGLGSGSFSAGGHANAQGTLGPLASALLPDTEIVASNGQAAVIAHDGDHRGVWITWMVEFSSTTDDGLRLMYNSLVWAAGHEP